MKETRDAQREIRKIQWGEKRERSTEEAVSVSQAKEKAELFFSPSSWMEAEGGAMSQIDFAGLAVYVVTTCYYLRSVYCIFTRSTRQPPHGGTASHLNKNPKPRRSQQLRTSWSLLGLHCLFRWSGSEYSASNIMMA